MCAVRGTAERLVREEMLASHVKKPEALRRVANAASVSPGSIERLLKGRLKHVDRIREQLNGLLVRSIEGQIKRLEGELAIARLKAARPDEVDLVAAQAALDEAKRLLGK